MPIRHIYWSRKYGKFRYFWPRLEIFHIEVYLVSARQKFRFASDPAYLLPISSKKIIFRFGILYQSPIAIILPPPKSAIQKGVREGVHFVTKYFGGTKRKTGRYQKENPKYAINRWIVINIIITLDGMSSLNMGFGYLI